MKKKGYKIKQTAANVLCVIAAMVLIGAGLMLAFGIKPVVVLTGSMEPTIETGSLAFIDTRDRDVKPQEIIAFETGGQLVTHRVVGVSDGVYRTKGDANRDWDSWTLTDENIVGKTIWWIPGVGYALRAVTGKAFAYSTSHVVKNNRFTVGEIRPPNVTISFVTNGGTSLAPLTGQMGCRLQDFSEGSRTTTRLGYVFTGWFRDSGLGTSFGNSTAINEDITLYAGWRHKHIGETDWAEIRQIADAGLAEEVFDECFQTVKTDLADDGKLSSSNHIHTRDFAYNGGTYHAIIAGFGQDTKSTGGATKMTFMTYEGMNVGAYNSASDASAGWSGSRMRNTAISSVYSGLPAAMRNVLVPVRKVSAAKSQAGVVTIGTTTDTLWIPSEEELYGAAGYTGQNLSGAGSVVEALTATSASANTDYGQLKSVTGEGSRYSLFTGQVPDGTANAERIHARGYEWWTRSLDPNGLNACYVDSLGAARTLNQVKTWDTEPDVEEYVYNGSLVSGASSGVTMKWQVYWGYKWMPDYSATQSKMIMTVAGIAKTTSGTMKFTSASKTSIGATGQTTVSASKSASSSSPVTFPSSLTWYGVPYVTTQEWYWDKTDSDYTITVTAKGTKSSGTYKGTSTSTMDFTVPALYREVYTDAVLPVHIWFCM